MFCQIPWWKRKLIGLSFKLFNILEDNWNADFNHNGERYFVQNLLRAYKKKKKDSLVIFDVGAYEGHYSGMIRELSEKLGLYCEFHLFEPQRFCYMKLCERFANNRHFHLNNFAVSEHSGEIFIYYEQDKRSTGSVYRRNSGSQRELVRSERLDKYIQENDIRIIDFLKIDTEGNDYKVLISLGEYLRNDFVYFIQFEYGESYIHSHNNLFDFYDLLESRGFVLGKIRPCGVEIRKWHPKFENYMYSNYVAISQIALEFLF
ncbi:MAG: FkbM family methyltransferase [Candidatus Calescibacterium sp.]|nr:FkbM family methyltransferase [Candidatus Calescibacterium sp.]